MVTPLGVVPVLETKVVATMLVGSRRRFEQSARRKVADHEHVSSAVLSLCSRSLRPQGPQTPTLRRSPTCGMTLD